MLASVNRCDISFLFPCANRCTFLTKLISGRLLVLDMGDFIHYLRCGAMSSHILSSPFASSPIYVKNLRLLLSFGPLNSKKFCLRVLFVLPYFCMSRPMISGELHSTKSNGIVAGSPCTSEIVR